MVLRAATGLGQDDGDGPQMLSGLGRGARGPGAGEPLRAPPAVALSKSPASRAPALHRSASAGVEQSPLWPQSSCARTRPCKRLQAPCKRRASAVQAPCERRASAVRAPRSFSTLYFLQTSTRATSTCFEAQLRRPGGARPPASGFGGSDLAATVFCGAWSPIPRFPPPRDPAWTSAPRLRGQPTADVRSGRT